MSVAPRMISRKKNVSTTSATKQEGMAYLPGEWSPNPLAANPLAVVKPACPLAIIESTHAPATAPATWATM